MPVSNIKDNRKNKNAWKQVWGVVEPTAHDNSIKDSDQTKLNCGFIIEWTTEPKPLRDVLEWANTHNGDVTLFIYDFDAMKTKK